MDGIMGQFCFSASITIFPTIRYFDLAESSISSYFELRGWRTIVSHAIAFDGESKDIFRFDV